MLVAVFRWMVEWSKRIVKPNAVVAECRTRGAAVPVLCRVLVGHRVVCALNAVLYGYAAITLTIKYTVRGPGSCRIHCSACDTVPGMMAIHSCTLHTVHCVCVFVWGWWE